MRRTAEQERELEELARELDAIDARRHQIVKRMAELGVQVGKSPHPLPSSANVRASY